MKKHHKLTSQERDKIAYWHAIIFSRHISNVVTQQYPNLLKSDYLSFGGRFPMLPIEDLNGSALKGIEFGQGMFKRDSIPIDARNKLLNSTADKGLATSGVIALVMEKIQSELTPENFELLRNRYRLKGRAGLLSNKEFSDSYTRVKQSLIGLGRDENYPILDRDAQKVFPHFTKAITSFSS